MEGKNKKNKAPEELGVFSEEETVVRISLNSEILEKVKDTASIQGILPKDVINLALLDWLRKNEH